jgi:Ser/Thr protein kinase RdoA (MazF antagonist)
MLRSGFRILTIPWEAWEGTLQIDRLGGSGLDPAVLDSGFLLVSCDATPPWTPSVQVTTFHTEIERINAIIDGYCHSHRLTNAERDRLSDALRFRSLVFGAWNFASAIASEQENEPLWWEIRYNAAEEIAERARKRFAMYHYKAS